MFLQHAFPLTRRYVSRILTVKLFYHEKSKKEYPMKVSVDKDLCTGCGLCTETAPEVFELVDDLATVKVTTIKASWYDAVREAADDCPTEAIIIEE